MDNPSIIICLTGYMGSGKTTVKNMFAKYANISTTSSIEEVSKKRGIVVVDSVKNLSEYHKLKALKSKVVLVSVECQPEIRMERLKERDKCSGMELHLRDKQGKTDLYDLMTEVKYKIYNDRSLEDTEGQVYYIHSLLSPSRVNIPENLFQHQR